MQNDIKPGSSKKASKAAPLIEIGKSTDPILNLAAFIAAADKAVDECDRGRREARQAADGMAETYFETADNHHTSRYFMLKEALSCHEAKTLEGAMVQAAECYSTIDDIINHFNDPFALRKSKMAMERMLMSIIRVLEREAAIDLEGLGLSCLRCKNLDPWEEPAKRISLARGEINGEGREMSESAHD